MAVAAAPRTARAKRNFRPLRPAGGENKFRQSAACQHGCPVLRRLRDGRCEQPGLAARARSLIIAARAANGRLQPARRKFMRIPESSTMSATVTPLAPAVGAEVANVDLRSLSDADFAL